MTQSGRLRGANGRFVPLRQAAIEGQGSSEVGGSKPGGAKGTLRPAQCGVYLRRELANWFPAIVEGFVKQAQSGSVPHFKLTRELLQEPAAQKTRKGSAQKLLEELERMDRDTAPGVKDAGAAEEDAWQG